MNGCPPWADDAAEHQLLAGQERARVVVRAALDEARTVSPNGATIAKWHRELFEDVVPLPYYAGNYRQHHSSMPCLARDVGVQTPGGVLAGSTYRAVLADMTELVSFMSGEIAALLVAWPALSREDRIRRTASFVGTAVGAFVRIHPFINGNGRTSRLLWKAILRRLNLPSRLTVIVRPCTPYAEVMQAAMAGDYAPAMVMVLRALAVDLTPRSVSG